jgi:hypothetical protein
MKNEYTIISIRSRRPSYLAWKSGVFIMEDIEGRKGRTYHDNNYRDGTKRNAVELSELKVRRWIVYRKLEKKRQKAKFR